MFERLQIRRYTLGIRIFCAATVEVSAPTFRLAAGALYTVRAYSGLGTRFVYDVVSVFPANLSSSFNLLSVDINNAILSLNSALELSPEEPSALL